MRKNKGMALFTVLVVMGVLVTMTGAFVAANHSNFALMAAASEQEEATSACQAGYSYAMFCLEHDRRFGKNFQDEAPEAVDSLFQVSVVNRNTLTGRVREANDSFNPCTFTLEIVNNIPLDSAVTTDRVNATGTYPAVPPDCAFLRITGNSGGVTRVLETMVTYAPLFDSAAQANGRVDIYADERVDIDSKDRFRNFLRSNADIQMGDSSGGSNVKFHWTADAVLDGLKRKGTLWARNEIEMMGKKTSNDGAWRVEQEDRIEGLISPKATREHQILDIKYTDFRMADDTPSVQIMDGVYAFGSADYRISYTCDATFENTETGERWTGPTTSTMPVSFPALERQVSITGESGVRTQTTHLWVNPGDLPKTGAFPSDYNVPSPTYEGDGTWKLVTRNTTPIITSVDLDETNGDNGGMEGKIKVTQVAGGKVNLAEIATGSLNGVDPNAVVIDINSAEFKVKENLLLEVPKSNGQGAFEVVSEANRFATQGGWEGRDIRSVLKLGLKDARTGEPGTGMSGVKSAGDMRVRDVVGRGALVAGKDLTIAAGGDTSSDELALFANENVIMDPSRKSASGDAEVTTVTERISSHFRGLVYARKNFIVKSPGDNVRHDVVIEGSLVAKEGDIRVREAASLNLTYNPIFSKKMLKDRPDYDVVLERQSYNLY